MLFGKNKEIKSLDINEGYQRFLKDERILLLCADEDYIFEKRHPKGAQCLPLRIIDQQAKDQLESQDILYLYANKKGTSYEAVKRLTKQGFEAYDLGSLVAFTGPEEGLAVKGKRSKHKDHNH